MKKRYSSKRRSSFKRNDNSAGMADDRTVVYVCVSMCVCLMGSKRAGKKRPLVRPNFQAVNKIHLFSYSESELL